MFFILVCNTPAILSFDPFPNYRPSTIDDTVTRQKREIIEDNEQQEEIENQKLINNDKLDLEKLRQQVDDVLKKVEIIFFFIFLIRCVFFLLISLQLLINV